MVTENRQVLFRNARVFDGTGAQPRAGVDVLVEGSRIAAVGTDAAPRTGLSASHLYLRLRSAAARPPAVFKVPDYNFAIQMLRNCSLTLL